MSKKPITIEEADFPNVLINGEKYDFLCDYIAKDGSQTSIYADSSGYGVVIDHGGKEAIVGLFSVHPDRISSLMDYMEATLPHNGTFDSFSKDFEEYMVKTAQKDRRYPKITSGFVGQQGFSLYRILPQLNPRDHFSRSFAKQIQEHTAPIKIANALDSFSSEDFAVQDPPEVLFARHSPAKNLSAGWEWIDYDDGSGCLKSPSGESFYSYDLFPYHNTGGIEYKAWDGAPWRVVYGSLDDFKQSAEIILRQQLSMPSKELDSLLQDASSRTQHSIRTISPSEHQL